MRVLIVDDSLPMQTRLHKLLVQVDKGITINQAHSCQEAIEIFSAFDPEVAILDIELPDGSGIGLLRRFKEVKSSVAVILFTNYPSDEFKKSCMDLGALDFIDKSDIVSLAKTMSSLKAYYS
jgi:DNA-binding response OmpR family regulator